MMQQRVQTMRGPKGGTATSSGQRSAFRMAWRWQSRHDTSERTDAELTHVRKVHGLDLLVRLPR
jgi:hypothetical protein